MSGLTLTRRGRQVRAVLVLVAVALIVVGAVAVFQALTATVVPVSDAAWQAGLDAARARMGH